MVEGLDNYELRINKIMKKYETLLFNNPNIIGFGRGFKKINNQRIKKPSLIIYVKKKLSSSSLNREEVIPKYFNGVITDIVESKEKILLSRPVYGGMNVGNEMNKSGGTITCALSERGTQNNIYLLSCNHVLTREDGEFRYRGKIGDKILQPTIKSGGDNVKSVIGKLCDIAPLYYEVNKLATKRSSADAAIAKVGENTKENQKKLMASGLLNGIELAGTATITYGQKIFYFGDTSGRVDCYIDSVGGGSKVSCKISDTITDTFIFEDVIVADMVGSPGDSGALGVIKKGNEYYAVAMLFSGIDDTGLFIPINNVLNHFKLELLKPK